jgi:hypothetical protein
MSTHSDTTRAIDRKQTNPVLAALVIASIALTASCSMSLVDNGPEVLRYCQVAERSEPLSSRGSAGQPASSAVNASSSQCAGGADRVCEDAEIVHAIAEGDAVNCGP